MIIGATPSRGRPSHASLTLVVQVLTASRLIGRWRRVGLESRMRRLRDQDRRAELRMCPRHTGPDAWRLYARPAVEACHRWAYGAF